MKETAPVIDSCCDGAAPGRSSCINLLQGFPLAFALLFVDVSFHINHTVPLAPHFASRRVLPMNHGIIMICESFYKVHAIDTTDSFSVGYLIYIRIKSTNITTRISNTNHSEYSRNEFDDWVSRPLRTFAAVE